LHGPPVLSRQRWSWQCHIGGQQQSLIEAAKGAAPIHQVHLDDPVPQIAGCVRGTEASGIGRADPVQVLVARYACVGEFADDMTGNGATEQPAQLCTAAANGGTPGYFNGVAFGGGRYFEATFSFSGAPSSVRCAFWANDVESMAGGSAGDVTLRHWAGQPPDNGNWIEIDAIEFNTGNTTQYGLGVHNWFPCAELDPVTVAAEIDIFDGADSVAVRSRCALPGRGKKTPTEDQIDRASPKLLR
jgi:hypothetical protein